VPRPDRYRALDPNVRPVRRPDPDAVALVCLYRGDKVRLTRFTVDHETGTVRGLDRHGRPATIAFGDVGHLHLLRDRSGCGKFACPTLHASRAHNHEEAPRAHA
jgi:hypothetical protein